MKIKDRTNIIKCILKKNKRDWIQIVLFSFLMLLVLASMTAFYSYQRFEIISFKEGIDSHKMMFSGNENIDAKELLSIVSNFKGIKCITSEGKIYVRAHANSKMVEFYSIPTNVDLGPKELKNLKPGEVLISNKLALKVAGRKYKGKRLIGKTVEITIENSFAKKVKVVGTFDSSDYGIARETAFLTEQDLAKITEVGNKALGEYTSIGTLPVAFFSNSSYVAPAIAELEKHNVVAFPVVSPDEEAIATIERNISLMFFISVFLFFVVKNLYLNNYFSKEKTNIAIFLTSGYSYKEIYKLYAFKNIICSFLSIISSIVIYYIGILVYNIWKEDLVCMGLKAVLPLYLFIFVYIVAILTSIIITKCYFQKIKKLEISEFVRYD